jgi:hypothetical protein
MASSTASSGRRDVLSDILKERVAVNLTVEIPDDIANRLTEAGADLSRRALEAFALEELKTGRITEPELCRMLGLARLELDGFLKSHGVYDDYTLEDFEKERAALKNLGR